MAKKISPKTRDELLDAIRARYREASKDAKGRILDEVVALMNCHRKHAVRLLRVPTSKNCGSRGRKHVYDDAVREGMSHALLKR